MNIKTSDIKKMMIDNSGLSQRDLAKKIGVTESSISRYVKGDREPKFEIIVKIASACKCKLYIERLDTRRNCLYCNDEYGERLNS